MTSKYFLAITSLFILGLNVSCEKSKHKKKAVSNQYVLVHGDPMNLINGTERNTRSFLTPDNFKSFDGFTFPGGLSFVDKELVERREYNPKAENAATTGDEKEEIITYTFEKNGDRLSYVSDNSATPNLEFVLRDGRYELTAMSKRGSELPVQILHYSSKPDGFTFLFSFHDDEFDQEAMMYLTFVKDEDRFDRLTTSDEYNYIAGEGVRAFWPGTIDLSICEKDKVRRDLLIQGVKDWLDEDGKLAGRPFNLHEPKSIPPFSDVNANCIQFAPIYRMEDTDQGYTMGVTLPIMAPKSQTIRFSNVFVFERAYERFSQERLKKDPETYLTHSREDVLATIRHELGHQFGLDHEFEVDSIMGYDKITKILPRDLKVMKANYKDLDIEMQRRNLASQICRRSKVERTFKENVLEPINKALYVEPDHYDSCTQAAYEIAGRKTLSDLPESFSDLSLVGKMYNLEIIDLAGTKVSDLSSLSQLPKLNSLDLSDTAVTDLRPLAGIKTLEHVFFKNNQAVKAENCPKDAESPGVREFCATL